MDAAQQLVHDPNLAAKTAAVVPRWSRAGENIGVGSDVVGLHNAFYNSASHRANMLGAYNQVGVGVVLDRGTIWVTFRFAQGTLPVVRDTTGPAATFTPSLAATQQPRGSRWGGERLILPPSGRSMWMCRITVGCGCGG